MSEFDNEKILELGKKVLEIEGAALNQMAHELGAEFAEAVRLIHLCKGRVILSGMGKSGHIARKIAATLASTGTPAHFVHPAEASHGDLGMITPNDICIVLSNSGETSELSDVIAHTRRFGIPLIGVASRAHSTLLRSADISLVLPNAPEACAIGMAPTTSTTATLALGDALAVAVMELRGFSPENFNTYHPGGKLGAQLIKVEGLMHSGDELPLVRPDTVMIDTIMTMNEKMFGLVGLIDDNDVLCGIITDGDLRRNLDGLLQKTAADIGLHMPRTVGKDMLAIEALTMMNNAKISAVFVIDETQKPIGLLHIHDCLRAGLG
ncbi:MAG: arabinose-5-phosphate isomerase [Hyphomonadaceae bacterium]|nr:MAG: arabinose-5-phosphate isomerase [Hyphomonadaceae bacterium]